MIQHFHPNINTLNLLNSVVQNYFRNLSILHFGMNMFRNIVLVLLALMGLTSVSAATEGKQPKLIVGIVVDQMRWDYLQRYQDNW